MSSEGRSGGTKAGLAVVGARNLGAHAVVRGGTSGTIPAGHVAASNRRIRNVGAFTGVGSGFTVRADVNGANGLRRAHTVLIFGTTVPADLVSVAILRRWGRALTVGVSVAAIRASHDFARARAGTASLGRAGFEAEGLGSGGERGENDGLENHF